MLNNRVAVVTGGTQGIGYAVSRILAEDGYAVVAIYKSNEEAARKVEAELKALQASSCVYSCDVCRHEDIQKLFRFVAETYDRVDVVVNNAGGGDLVY